MNGAVIGRSNVSITGASTNGPAWAPASSRLIDSGALLRLSAPGAFSSGAAAVPRGPWCSSRGAVGVPAQNTCIRRSTMRSGGEGARDPGSPAWRNPDGAVSTCYVSPHPSRLERHPRASRV